jgi:hypothetical protein
MGLPLGRIAAADRFHTIPSLGKGCRFSQQCIKKAPLGRLKKQVR